MIRVVIADDIPDTLAMVCDLVKEVYPEAEIVGRHTSLSEVQKSIDEQNPDAVLLDIQFVAEGKTAFDLLDYNLRNGKLKFKTIIFSGHCESAYYDMAFRYNALHFIPKPIDKLRLKEALLRIESPETKIQPVATTSILSEGKLVISTANLRHFVELKKIVYLQTEKAGTNIHLANGAVLKSSRNLGYYEEQVAENPNFIRIHNNTIVNVLYVESTLNIEKEIILKSPFGKLKSSRDRFKIFLTEFSSLHK